MNIDTEQSLRSQLGKTPREVQKDFIDRENDLDNITDIYSGKVVNNNDPDKQGKCKIRVYGVFGDDIPDEDLPWALPDFSFIGSKVGSFIVPPIDAIVKVYFDHGDIYLPHYTTKAVVSNSQPSQKDIDYPDNMVFFETEDGDYFTVNRKTKEHTYFHHSGTKLLIKDDGSIEVEVEKDLSEKVKGDKEEDVTGEITIKGLDVKVEATKSVDIKGKVDLTVHGTPVPLGTPGGPFCLLPTCVITGAPHATNKTVGGTP